MMAKMTKAQTKRSIKAVNSKLNKMMDDYFQGVQYISLADMKKIQKMRIDLVKMLDKIN